MRIAACIAMLTWIITQSASAQEPLVQVATIDLPRVQGRIDHLAIDRDGQRAFVAALGNNSVEVVDLRANAHVKSLAGFREPQGIAVLAGLKMVAIANGEGEGIRLLSTDDYEPTQSVRLGDDADNVRYDSSARRVYVGYGAGALASIDATNGEVLGQVHLAGHPESFQLESTGRRAF